MNLCSLHILQAIPGVEVVFVIFAELLGPDYQGPLQERYSLVLPPLCVPCGERKLIVKTSRTRLHKDLICYRCMHGATPMENELLPTEVSDMVKCKSMFSTATYNKICR